MLKIEKPLFLRLTLVSVSLMLSVLLFVQLVDLMVSIVKLHSGLRAAGGLFALIPLSVLELSFFIAVGPHYRRHARAGDLLGAFFRVTSIQLFLFAFLEVLRFLAYGPVFRSSRLPFYALWRPINYLNALGGIVLGVIFAVLALWYFRSFRSRG